jgi:hypothetical protein
MPRWRELPEGSEIRVGDRLTATYSWNGEPHEFTGEVWLPRSGRLYVGGTAIHDYHERLEDGIAIIKHERQTPDVPQETGAVIDAIIRQPSAPDVMVRLMRTNHGSPGGPWVASTQYWNRSRIRFTDGDIVEVKAVIA